MKPIIRVENLSKQYRLGTIGTGTLSNDLKRWWFSIRGKEDPFVKIGDTNDRSTKAESEYVWALRDINFEVSQGEILGIIGKNGAGKSTLLKILSKVTGPTTGRIDYNGRIGSLLEVGTGFHPELTGRENIFLNGAILGMTKTEIRSKLDEIIDFSGCERYIDTPVKRYSSGMTVRLGFAVAAHLEPEILVVDEVLAVGDAEFQKKAIGKMHDVSRNDGRTVLFVSHNMAAVKSLCNKGLLIQHGTAQEYGSIDSILRQYSISSSNNKGLNQYRPLNNIVTDISATQVGSNIIMCLKYESSHPIRMPNFGFVFYDVYGNPIFGANPVNHYVSSFGEPKKKGEVIATIKSPLLVEGQYPISIWFSDGVAHSQSDHIFFGENCLNLDITGTELYAPQQHANSFGSIASLCEWNFN